MVREGGDMILTGTGEGELVRGGLPEEVALEQRPWKGEGGT